MPSRRILPCLLLASMTLAGCPDASPPAATPLQAERLVPDDVALSSIEAVVPRDLSAYEAWQVQRQSSAPMRVVLERFVRNQCYSRQSFVRRDDSGNLVPEGPPLRGVRAINPTTEQRAPTLLLAHALDKDRLPHGGRIHVARHGRQQPAWSFARLPTMDENGVSVDVTTEFRYDIGGCALPPRLMATDIPAPRIADLPNTEVIDRQHAIWVPIGDADRGRSCMMSQSFGDD